VITVLAATGATVLGWVFFGVSLVDFFHSDLIFKVIRIERIDPSFLTGISLVL
jgi:hypothetical protein